jgi:hypothetical protein
MPTDRKRLFCDMCDEFVLAERDGFNHTPHLLMTLLCCGFWLPVWAILSLTYNTPFRCSHCGRRLSHF